MIFFCENIQYTLIWLKLITIFHSQNLTIYGNYCPSLEIIKRNGHNIMKYNILEQYKSGFENPRIYVKSPGRANIIGEHTDYNNGLVLPFAIKQCIHMYIGQNQMGFLRIFACDINEYVEIDLIQLEFQKTGWARYFVNSLVSCGYDLSNGIDVVFGGNLPQGGGVSSSSALTCGFLAGINALFKMGYSVNQMIRLASEAENGIGLNGGIMDQTVIFKGMKHHALKIDFLDFSIEEFEVPNSEYSFYIFNSGQKHNLVDTEYNKRRATCEKALKTIQTKRPNVKTLRDVTQQDIDTYLVNEISKKRCRHVLEENNRVHSVTQALKENKYEHLGSLLLESHGSLSNNYDVSTGEIDYLVERSQEILNMLGSRIMGGGFGGCTINFVKGKLSKNEIKKLKSDYKNKTGYGLKVDKIEASNGIQITHL